MCVFARFLPFIFNRSGKALFSGSAVLTFPRNYTDFPLSARFFSEEAGKVPCPAFLLSQRCFAALSQTECDTSGVLCVFQMKNGSCRLLTDNMHHVR